MREKIRRFFNSQLGVVFSVAVASFFVAIILGSQDGFSSLELESYNIRFSLRGTQNVEADSIVIVGFDEQSFSTLGMKWPFPRSYFARAIDNLNKAGARLIIFDVELFEPDKEKPQNDNKFAESLSRNNNVILASEVFEYRRRVSGTNVLEPIDKFKRSGVSWAFVTVPEDQDGFHRRYFVFKKIGKRNHFPFALTAYNRLRPQEKLKRVDNGIAIGASQIPLVDAATFLVNFRGPGKTFPTYSFSSIIDDRSLNIGEFDDNIFDEHLTWETFKNKVVFIGATAPVLQDVKLTPFYGYEGAGRMPGVEVHANALSTLLRKDYIHLAHPFWQMLITLLLAGVVAAVAMRAKLFAGIVWIFCIGTVYIIVTWIFFTQLSTWLEWVRPLSAMAIAYVGSNLHQILFERKEKGRVRQTFQQYVAKNVVDSMLARGNLPKFGGERRNLTVLFSDIRSFTSFCERHSERTVVGRLTEYLTAMHDVILGNVGTLDKFVGDEIMAIFGAPMHFDAHPEKACEAACEMMQVLRVLQKKWDKNGGDGFNVGIGINTGNMIVGNLGSQKLFDYTVIGDQVNLAARLEGANKQYETNIIISESTYRQVKEKAICRELDFVRVRGKEKPVGIFELIAMKKQKRTIDYKLLELHAEGMMLYKNREWFDSLKKFKEILSVYPKDGPARLYIKRCLDFIESPPADNWDGVYDFKSK